MNTSRLPEKCHTHLFLTLKEFAALGIHVLQWLQLFELMSKAQNHQIQSIKSFPKIKGKANIPVHAPRFAKSQYLQKDKQINNQKISQSKFSRSCQMHMDPDGKNQF